MKRSISQAFARKRAVINRGVEARHQELQNLTEEYIQRCNHIAKAIQALLEQRNDLAPVSRLPPELLSCIFLLDAGPCDEDGFQSCESPLGWLHALWVCRYWRRVAIATSQLWVQVPLMHVGYVEAALHRSAGLPLTIQLPPDTVDQVDRNPLSIYQMLQREIHRIHAVNFTVTDQVLPSLRALEPITSEPYPCALMLEKLRLRCSSWVHRGSAPAGLSSLLMPRLHSLTISEAWSSLASSLARPTVTSLDLSFANNVRVEPNSLLVLLDGMPLLQHPKLRNLYHAILPVFPPVDTRTVLLPHLQYIHLHGTGLNMVHLLQHLSFTNETRIRFQAICMQGRAQTYELILPLVISRAFVAHTPVRSSSTQLLPNAMVLNTTDFRLRLWRSSLNARDLEAGAFTQQPPHLEFSSYGNCIKRPMSALSFLNSLDLSALSVLHITPHSMPRDYWVGIFCSLTLPKLAQICLSDSNAGCSNVFRALRTLTCISISTEAVRSEEHITPRGRHLFPALKTLKLDDVSAGHVTKLLRNLSKFLQHRATAGMRLKTLEINIPWHLAREGLVNATLRDVHMYTRAQSVKITDASGVLKHAAL